ncbi:H-NS histone family protein [Variovorax gossypii]
MTSLEAIATQIADHEREVTALRAQAALLQAAERSDAIGQVRAKIEEHGLTASEIGLGATGANRLASTAVSTGPYFHPNSLESWSGRGRRPLWVESALATGHSLKSLQRPRA